MARVHLIVRGLVQGVGFRWFASREARSLGITGWVANRADGSVEIEAQAAPGTLATYLEVIRRGPSRSRVERVDEAWGEERAGLEGFEIRGGTR
jgi:acylphosphatase